MIYEYKKLENCKIINFDAYDSTGRFVYIFFTTSNDHFCYENIPENIDIIVEL